jgi:prepilin-type N-terminal cleavage/methylation domain-containing protein
MKRILPQKNKSRSGQGGFTLVETLVAISIFTISLLGLLSILASGISNTTYAKRKITAEYLAEEGIEYVRNMRDTYVLYSADSQTGWTSFVNKLSSCTGAGYCGFNSGAPGPSSNIFVCSGNLCELYLFNGGYSVDHSAGTDSGFLRKIQMTPVSGTADEVKISSSVSWTQGSGNYNITFTENLFNWVQ